MYEFEIFADESGTHDTRGLLPGSEVMGVIGYFNTKKNWDIVSRRWNTRLKKAKLTKPFHMREFRNNPPFNKWSQKKRDKFERSLAKVARDTTWFVIGATVPVKDYDEVVPKWLKDSDQHPYFFCFRLFLDAVLHVVRTQVDPILRVKNKGYRKNDEPIAFIFDRQQTFQDQAIRTFNGVKELRDIDDRMGSITFGSRKQYVPLQAADLMAYYGRRIVAHDIKGEAWRDPMERFLEERHNLMIYKYNREGLIKWVEEVEAVRTKRLKNEDTKMPTIGE